MTDNGLTTIASAHSVAETIDRLVAGITPLGMNVFARIDHAAGAAKVDMPLKALAWQDADGKVWLSYNEASWIAQRHGLGAASAAAVTAIAAGLEKVAKAAAAK